MNSVQELDDKLNNNKERDTDYSLLVDTAILLGEIMLKNGAETNRVEKTMHKLLKTTNMKHIEAVVMTTSIIVTLSDPSIEHITAVSRIHERTTNLNRVNLANNLVIQYCNGKINLEELFHELKEIKKINIYNKILKNVAMILVAPSFTLMLNGTFLDAIASLICSIIIVAINKVLQLIKISDFLKNILSIFVASFIAVWLSRIIYTNIQTVIVGFIMPYVPGVAITNAVRDTFNADYMSGSARLLDAIVQAFVVALGVYLGLNVGSLILI